MVSEFAGDLIKTIVEQRSQLAGQQFLTVTPFDSSTFLDSTIQQAKNLLSHGLQISVHLSLAPLKCGCPEECRNAFEFEIWSLKVDKVDDNSEADTSHILPIFLRQAILSQLHFSPFSSWLLEKYNGRLPATDYRCVYRLSTNSEFPTPRQTKSHNFPTCIVQKDEKELLKVRVKLVCKNEFSLGPACCELAISKLSVEDSSKKFTTNPDVTNNEAPPTDDGRPLVNTSVIPERLALSAFTASPSSTTDKLLPNPLLAKRLRRNTTGSDCETPRSAATINRRSQQYNGSPVPWKTRESRASMKLFNGSPTKSGLLCNFEESALKGRLEPIASVEGFKVQIIIQSRFNIPTMEIPLQTYFFNVSDDDTPSLYFGHADLNKPIRISKVSTIQATIFNPQGSVVKIFKIPVDVRDMPASSKTFLRQRTYCMPKGLPIEEATKTWLRYLTHFRFVTDRHGRLFLHTDIRCLFSNKSDLDVQNLASGQEFHLVSHTQFPQEPKYSTIQ